MAVFQLENGVALAGLAPADGKPLAGARG